MKKAIQVIFWVFSGALFLMAIVLLTESALTSGMLIGCSALINPLFSERVPLKKGWTALLLSGLFIASVAVYPTQSKSVALRSAETKQALQESTTQPNDPGSSLREISADIQAYYLKAEPTEADIVSTNPTQTPKTTATEDVTQTPKPTPIVTATPKPTSSPTKSLKPMPKPTTKPVPITRAAGITIVEYSDSVRCGSFVFIEIQGVANTDYTCEVEYKTTMSSADGLGTKRSDANGYVSWHWKVGSRTSLDYMPTIYIDGDGASVSVQFDVTE